MEEAKALTQQQLLFHHHQQQQQNHQHQQHPSQHISMLQQFQQQKLQQQQSHQQLQQQAMARFPSNIDAHLRTPGLLNRPVGFQSQQHHQNPNPNPNPSSCPILNSNPSSLQQQPNLHQQQSQPQQRLQQQQQLPSSSQPQHQPQGQQLQKPVRPDNTPELQMAYQDALRVCRPDFKRPFSSLEDACERLLPYHVVADYEAEEDDRFLDSDTTGNVTSRSQQWDHNIAVKVAQFTTTFENQALAFNIISRKRGQGDFRSEERLMIEQALLQEERRAIMELRTEITTRERAGREAQEVKLRMATMAQVDPQASARVVSLGSRGNAEVAMGRGLAGPEFGVSPREVMNGWGSNGQRDEKEALEDFLNDEETENGEAGVRNEWRDAGELDLNAR